MAFPAFLDTCVLFSPTLTDTLLRIADEGAFRPHWSSEVLEELQSALVNKAQISSDAARRRIGHMESAFPEATVTDYEVLISAMTCHPKDRHVLAAAAAASAHLRHTYPPESRRVGPRNVTGACTFDVNVTGACSCGKGPAGRPPIATAPPPQPRRGPAAKSPNRGTLKATPR